MGIPAAIGVSASGRPNSGDKASAVVSGTLTAVGPGDPFAFRGPTNWLIYASVNTALTTTNGSTSASVVSGTGLAPGVAIKSANVPPGTTWATFSGTTGTLAFPAKTLACGGVSLSSSQLIVPAGCSASSLVGATISVPSTVEGVTFPTGTTVTGVIQADVAPTQGNPNGVPGIVALSAPPTAVPVNNSLHFVRFALTSNSVTTGTDSAALFTGAAIAWSGTVQIERSFDGGNTWVVCSTGSAGTPAQYSTGTPVSIVFGEPERFVLYRMNCIAYTSGTINYRISETGGANESLTVGPLSGG